jgi:hypothetical protein
MISSQDSTMADISGTAQQQKSVNPKKKTPRCPECQHKLMLSDLPCRCGSTYCMNHRFPESHKCTFDYKTHEKDLLTKSLVKVVAEKVATIA